MNVSGSKHESGSIWSAKKIKKQAELNIKVEDMKLANFIKLNNVSDVNRNVHKKAC